MRLRFALLLSLLLPPLVFGLLNLPVPARAENPLKVASVDAAYCLKVVTGSARSDDAKCPSFMTDGLADAARECDGVGGKLVALPNGGIYALDIDGDRRAEYLYQFTANFSCDGAPSYFSCGSADCPWSLLRDNVVSDLRPQPHTSTRWRTLGQFAGIDIAAVPHSGTPDFPDLTVRCEGLSFCDLQHYRWDGNTYAAVAVTLRGIEVKLFESSTLVAPPRQVMVRSAPKAMGESLGVYGTNAIFAVIGQVQGSDWLLVSPCSACDSGFVQTADLAKK